MEFCFIKSSEIDFKGRAILSKFDNIKSSMNTVIKSLIIANVLLRLSAVQYTRFKSAKAVSLNSSLLQLHFCDVKVYSRTSSVFNIGVTYLKPLYTPIWVAKTII